MPLNGHKHTVLPSDSSIIHRSTPIAMPADMSRHSADASPHFADPAVAALLMQWLQQVQHSPAFLRSSAAKSGGATPPRWIIELLPAANQALGGAGVSLTAQIGNRWQTLAHHGTAPPPYSESLISHCLEKSEPVLEQQAVAAVVHDGKEMHRTGSESNVIAGLTPTVLIAQLHGHDPGRTKETVQRIRQVAEVLRLIDQLQRDVKYSGATAGYLRQLLDVSLLWHHIDNTDQLLEAIASTATEMLDAERASIFLWDKRRGKLIGRPHWVSMEVSSKLKTT